MDLKYAESFARRVTEEAGKLLCKFFGSNDFGVKKDGSLQATADIEVETLVRNRVMRVFPQASFLGEESSELSDIGRTLWVCDPLDGTTNFVNGQPNWGVSLALLEDLRPLLGVVHIPILGETVSAVRGKGVFCKGKRVEARVTDGKQFSDIYTFCSWRSNKFSSNLPGNIRAFGSTAYHLAQFACGRTAGGWEMSAKIWDIAAGIILAQEAGGTVRLVDGGDPIERLRNAQDIRDQTLACIFAANPVVYELMRQDMIVTQTG
jgi:myo-inositol-1(or 4)-monophosphatase